MKAKNKRNNLRRVFSILTVFLILALTLAMPCFAWTSVSDYSAVNGVQGALTQRAMGVAFGEVIWTCCYSNTGIYFTNVDVSLIYDYLDDNPSLLNLTSNEILTELKSSITVYQPLSYDTSSVDNALLDAISVCVESYLNGEQVGYNNGLNVGSIAGKNQVMDEIIQNANSNGTDIQNQTYSPQALINVLNEIRDKSEYDGAFNREDFDIRYFVRELIRLGISAESYDTFELTVDGNLENAKNIWYLEGLEESQEGINQRLQQAYNTGYTQGGKDADAMNNTLITIFSSPYYILNEVFNFEIFGVSVAGIITFLLSILLVGWIIRIIL